MNKGIRIIKKTIFLTTFVLLFILGGIFGYKKYQEFQSPFCEDCNLIIISIDALRADHIGIYGYPKNITPNIDAWAKNATVFTNMHTAVPATYPSFASMLTGKNPLQNGIVNNRFFDKGVRYNIPLITKGIPTLTQILKSHGYYTAGFVTNPQLNSTNTNIGRGFDFFEYNSPIWKNENDRKPYENFINKSIKWLKDNSYKKTFLWIHLMDPHLPYTPLQQFECKFNDKFCKTIKEKGVWNLAKDRNRLDGCQQQIDQNEVELFKTLYDGELNYTDPFVGKIIDEIKGLKLDKKTVIMLYSDHGEGFDHNFYFNHGNVLYESALKTPLIIRYPKSNGVRINGLIQNEQISSILLELLGITKPNLINLSSNDKKLIYKGLNYSYSVNVLYSKYSVQNEQYKFIYSLPSDLCQLNNQTQELYDLQKDPDEINNIINTNPKVAEDLKNNLFNYLKNFTLPIDTQNLYSSDPVNTPDFEEVKSLGY